MKSVLDSKVFFLGIFISGYSACLGSVRFAMGISDKPKITREMVSKTEMYGFNDYVFFEHSNESTKISYYPDSFSFVSMIDDNADNLVDRILVDGNEYLRTKSCRFKLADEKFLKYCLVLDCESLINQWENNNPKPKINYSRNRMNVFR